MDLVRYSLYLTLFLDFNMFNIVNRAKQGLGSLSQLIRLWSMPYYRFTLNKESYFADTELAGFYERILSRSKSKSYLNGSILVIPNK